MLPAPLPQSSLPGILGSFRPRALAAVTATSLVLSAFGAAAGVATSAAAAVSAADTRTIGATPIALTQPSDPGVGALTPAADAAENGMFGPQVAWPIVPIQAGLARNGHLVSYGTPLDTAVQDGLVYDDWDPSTGWDRSAHAESASMHDYDSFCNALTVLDDGSMLMVGGNSTMSTMTYDPFTGDQGMGANLAQQRWYVTTLRLIDGRVLALGGADYYNTTAYQTPDDNSKVAMTPEIGTGTGAWSMLAGATSAYAFGAEGNRWWYPRAFNGANGTVFGMSGDHLWTLNTAGTGSVQPYGTLPWNPGVSGSQVMYAPGKILVAGGGQAANGDDVPATNAAAVVDITGAAGAIATTQGMANARNWLNLTVLPTGEVLANGGTRMGVEGGDANTVKQAEIWNPANGQWRTAATAQRTRTYHSVSLVLPSGAVFTGGGGVPGPEDNLNAEVYYPSYLFSRNAAGAVSWASRPAVSAISGSATYGGTVDLKIADGRKIASASLISAAVVTHSQNTDQRRIPLDIVQKGAVVSATLPVSMDTMPAGDYELTVVDAKGVPSPAQMITIRRSGAGQVTLAAGVVVADTSDAAIDTGAGAAEAPGAGAASGDAGAGAGVAAGAGTATGAAGGAGAPAGAAGGATAAPGASTSSPVGGTSPAVPTNTGTPGATPDGSVDLVLDRTVGLDSVNRPGDRVSRSGSRVVLRHVGQAASTSSRKATTWAVRTGLASASGVSFESADKPGFYLAAPATAAGAMKLEKNDGTARFAGRATYAAERGLTGQNTSFRVWSGATRYLRHQGAALVAAASDGTDGGRFDSTFTVRAGLTPASAVPLTAGRAIALQTSGASSSRVLAASGGITVKKVVATSSSAVRAAGSWLVRSGSSSNKDVSFESVRRPGFFLAASTGGTGSLTLVKESRSKSFAKRVTFNLVAGLSGQAKSLVLAAHPSLHVRHSGTGLVLQRRPVTSIGRAATAIVVHSAPIPARTP